MIRKEIKKALQTGMKLVRGTKHQAERELKKLLKSQKESLTSPKTKALINAILKEADQERKRVQTFAAAEVKRELKRAKPLMKEAFKQAKKQTKKAAKGAKKGAKKAKKVATRAMSKAKKSAKKAARRR